MPDQNANLVKELERSTVDLTKAVQQSTFKHIIFGREQLSKDELIGMAIQHEGIHQGQYHIALKKADFEIPLQWERDWNLQ